MSKKNKPEEIPSWIKDLYKEDLNRVVNGERPMYFRGMDDSPLRNVSPEFDILSGGAAVKGMNGIRGTLSPLNNGMGNYNFSLRGINKKIGELVDEAGLYLPEKLGPVYRTVVDAMSSSKDKGLGHITQPLANALYPADERRNRRLDGEYPVGYVDAIDGIWPMEKYGLWGEKIEDKQDGGEIEDIARKMYRSDLDRVIFGQSPIYYKQLDDKSLDDTHPEFDILTGGVSLKSAPSYKMGIVGKGNVFDNPWESSIYGRIFDKLDDYASIPNDVFTKYLGKTLRGIKKRIPDKDDKKKFQDIAEKVVNRVYEDLDYYVGLGSTMLVDDKEEKEEGGPVNTNRSYGSGKYVIDPRRSGDSKMAVYDEIWDYLTDKKGIPQTQAIGILSNIAAESGGDTTALGTAGDFGIQQWLGPRKKELQRRYGKKPTLTQQLDYLVDEYQGRVPGLGWNYMNQGKFFDKDAQGNVYNYYMYSKADFDNATNYKDATVAWNQGYGRPLGSTLRNEKRFEFADMFSNRYGVPENEPMRYEFGQRDSGTGDGGQQPVPETVAPAAPSLASHPAMDSWWEKEGQDLLYKMLAQSGANKKAIENIANNIKNDPQSEAQIAEAERMRKEQAKRQLVLNMIPGLMLNIKGMSRSQN